jgi:1-acyl-sn-glycerol-3-phosphate acyltransferase
VKIDLTKWLGPDYDKNKDYGRGPFIISNHQGWGDILHFMSSQYFPSFVAKAEVKKYPAFGVLAKMIMCHFIQRRDQSAREDLVKYYLSLFSSFYFSQFASFLFYDFVVFFINFHNLAEFNKNTGLRNTKRQRYASIGVFC